MTQPLNFRAEKDDYTASWERADPTRALIERTNPGGYTVTLRNGQVHHVAYEQRNGAYFGRCDCKGWEYRDNPHSPCAHLCALRKADYANLQTIDDHPIQPVEIDADHTGTTSTGQLATDGGRIQPPPAGHDQRTFGRPEGRL